MADNTTLNPGAAGDPIVTREIAHAGDTAKLQGVFAMGISGTEGAYTAAAIGGDATNGLDVDVTRLPALPAGTNNIGDVDVLTLPALPAGTNNIGDVDVLTLPALPAGTNNIGDVDVLSVVPGTGATNLGKAIDSAAGATDTGVAVLAIRDDSLSALTPAESDYVPLRVNSTGALHVTGGGGGTQYAEDAAHTTGDTGTMMLAVRVDSGASLAGTDGDYAPPQLDSTGNLRVRVAAGGITGVLEDAASAGGEEGILVLGVRRDTAASSSGTDGDFSTFNLDASGRLHVNVGNTVAVGSHAVTNAGTFATQIDGAALTALQLIDNPVLVDDAAFTPGTSSINMAGFQADEASTDSVDEGDAGAARMTLDRKLITTPQPHTAGGLSIFRSIDLDESEEEVKGTAGCVYSAWVCNTHTSTLYLKFYNATAANVTVGTTTPVITIPIPGNSADDISAVLTAGGYGIMFDTAITVAVTTGLADNDTGAPAANAFIANIFYK